MAEILSFQDAQRRHAQTLQHAADLEAALAERAEALSYVERMAAFHAEMQRLSARYDILGDGAADPRMDAEVVYVSAMRRA